MKHRIATPLLIVAALGTASTSACVSGSARQHNSGLSPTIGSTRVPPVSSTETLGAFFDFEWGYWLATPGNDQERIWVEFGSKEAENLFVDTFRAENLTNHLGQFIYCDCTGKRYEKGSRSYFLVESAKIYYK